jgi:DNA-binding response OmpR family regulator
MPGTVLIADDDPDILELITALLTEEGFQTVTCGDGIAALHLIRTQRPALALIDLGMPLINGYELIERLRAEPGEPLPVVAMSVAMYEPSPDQLQVDAYLAKPFDLEELLEHVNYLTSRENTPEIQNTPEQASVVPITRSIPGTH